MGAEMTVEESINLQVLHLATPQGKVPLSGDEIGEFGRPLTRQCLKEKWDSRVEQRNLSFPNFWYGSPHLHCIGGKDVGTERRGSTFWCGWDGKIIIEDNCGSQWVCRTQK